MVGENSHEHDNNQSTTSGEMSWSEALHILRPDELEKLKRYVAFYIAKYGPEGEVPTQESEGVS